MGKKDKVQKRQLEEEEVAVEEVEAEVESPSKKQKKEKKEKKAKKEKEPEPEEDAGAESDDSGPPMKIKSSAAGQKPAGGRGGFAPATSSAAPSKTVKFNGASWNVTEADFSNAFEGVESVEIFQRDGRPSGVGKIFFNSEESAQKVVEQGSADLAGRTTYFQFWEDRPSAPRGGAGGFSGAGSASGSEWTGGVEGDCVVFRNAPWSASEDSLKKVMPGSNSAEIFMNDEGKPRGVGKIWFNSVDEAKAIVAQGSINLDGRSMYVHWPQAQRAGGDQGGFGGGGRGGRGGGRGFGGGRGGRGGRGGW